MKPRFSDGFLAALQRKMESRRRELIELERGVEHTALVDLSQETTDEISHVRLHPADLGTTEFDQDVDLSLAESEIHEIQDIEDALSRIARGEYGICQECAAEIPFSRLEVVPYARYCAACENRMEARHKKEAEAGKGGSADNRSRM
jgi:RNA polymerase-binding transcription factor DksA